MGSSLTAEFIAQPLYLGGVLRRMAGVGAEHADHWQQGEFHHDHLFRIPSPETSDRFAVVSTNCNGGVKEVLVLDGRPERWAIWNWRCPENPEFEGEIPRLLDLARTVHYFNPCELLGEDARSELKPEYRRRMRGGGWEPA